METNHAFVYYLCNSNSQSKRNHKFERECGVGHERGLRKVTLGYLVEETEGDCDIIIFLCIFNKIRILSVETAPLTQS